MLPRVNSVCSYPLPYRDHGCEHYMSYTPPSLGMLSSDPLGMPDAEGAGRAVPPSGGAPCFPLTLGVETTGRERGMSEG